MQFVGGLDRHGKCCIRIRAAVVRGGAEKLENEYGYAEHEHTAPPHSEALKTLSANAETAITVVAPTHDALGLERRSEHYE